MAKFKVRESVALKSIPNREMMVIGINGDNTYKCSFFYGRNKVDINDYHENLLQKYIEPIRRMRLYTPNR